MVTPTKKLLIAMRDAWAPRERVSIADWAEREVRLPLTSGPNPRVDWDRFPYFRGVLDAAEDPEVEEIYMPAATQIGKTTILQLLLAGLAETRPAPAMLCAPDQDATKKLRDKFYGLCDATPCLRDKVPSKHKRNMSTIDFGNSVCHLAWTGNPQRVSAESCRVVLVTETDRAHAAMHEGALHKLISERTKAWHDCLKVFEGTPTDVDSTIMRLYGASNEQTNHCPCPHCGHFQPLRFFLHKEGEYAGNGGVDGMKDDKGNWRSSDKAQEAAYYRCEKGCRIENRDKEAMVRQGVWCPKGCEVIEGKVTGTPKRSRRRCGFGGLCSLYASTISIGRMAAEYLDSRDNDAEFQNFLNNWCALVFEVRTKTPRGYDLFQRLQHPHRRGTVPNAAIFLTAAGDVHDANTHWIVRAWGEGCTSWLVDWGVQSAEYDSAGKAVLGSQLSPLRGRVIEREWPVADENPLGQTLMVSMRTAIDSGWLPAMVHDFVRQFHSDLVLAVAGDPAPNKGTPWTFSKVDKNQRTGKVYPGGLKRWAINTDFYKTDIHDRWDAPLDEPGAWFITDAPWDDAGAYLRQVANEGKVSDVNRKTGFTRYIWKVLRPGLGNHFLDCYDAETEVLTHDGWKLFSALSYDDKLATNNLETDLLEYQHPEHLIAREYDGKMVQIGGDPRSRLNLLVTPTHRMVVYEGQKSRGPKVKQAGDLTVWDKIKTKLRWKGEPEAEYIVPRTVAMPERRVSRVALAYFLGWYIAEGYCFAGQHHSQPGSTKRRVTIYQNPGEKRDALRAGLQQLPWKFHETPRGIILANQQVYDLVKDLGDSYTKYVPAWIKQAPPDVIRAFLDGAVLGDGWRHRNSEAYATVSRRLADDIQELYLKAGFSSSMIERPPKPYSMRGRYGANTVKQYHVHRKTAKFGHLRNANNKPNFRTVDYTGKVYCATVPNGTLVVRRHGKVAICGNCEVYARCMADMIVGGKWTDLARRFAAYQQKQKTPQQEKETFIRKRKGGFIRGRR